MSTLDETPHAEAGTASATRRAKTPRPWYRKKRWWALGALIVLVAAIAGSTSGTHRPTTASAPATSAPAPGTSAPQTTTTAPPTTTTVPTRHNLAVATALGAGNFTGGSDVAAGLYDVTAGTGGSGNFIVEGPDSYNEILGTSDLGVPKVRAQISTGDSIQISGLSQVVFTPVTGPLVTAQGPATLYAGTWTVGQDLGPGRYEATPGPGQSGNFIITSEGVNEILGGTYGVANVTFRVQTGDVIAISGLAQVTLTPA